MDRDEFREMIKGDPHLGEPIARAAGAGPTRQFGAPTELATIALMFPIVKYVLTNIGLPWLYELKRYSEFQRQKVHDWIDRSYREEGFDPEAAEAAGDALCEQLDHVTTAEAQTAWERFAELFKASSKESTGD